jgi:tetratricopeptide (TPR) repeat protein
MFSVIMFIYLLSSNIYNFEKSNNLSSKKLYLPPPENLRLITFGYKENFADSLWLNWTQNSDVCGKEKIPRDFFEKSFSGYKAKNKGTLDLNLGYSREDRKVCDLSWSFLMLDAITNLAPKFRYAYITGATILSVLVEDHQGAALLYEKGLTMFPWDWKLHYGAAYHYLFELDDIQRAAILLRKAAELGGPEWTLSLASKLYSRAGQAFLGILTLKQYKQHLKSIGDEERIKEVDQRIALLETQLMQQKSSQKDKSAK